MKPKQPQLRIDLGLKYQEENARMKAEIEKLKMDKFKLCKAIEELLSIVMGD